ERHIVLAKPPRTVVKRPTAEHRIERGAERLIVLDASLALAKPCIARQRLIVERREQAIPEFVERGKMDRDQSAVGGAQDVSLRKARAIARSGRLTEREERRKRLDAEVRHRFQHGDFDYAPATGGGALHEGAEHAVRGVQPRD